MSVPQGRFGGVARRGPAAGGVAAPADPTPTPPGPASSAGASANPWNALWAMLIGFFMILVDSTIVAVANPSIMAELQTGYDAVIWVTSAYLLAYAVPLLVAGRLGDQFGAKNLYLIGLVVFTAASLWCGLSGSIEMLIAARVVQGLGAALLTPQTLSMITRIFPAGNRGVAMSVWGATAGVATLVGPLAGGVLVDHLGWQWIFFVNVPIGILGLALAWWLVPVLPTHVRRFDVPGVLLSGVAMFLIVFALQEGESQRWSGWIWVMIAAGVAVLAAFVYWQAVNRSEPLVPLEIFTDRNFSLANLGVAVIGFVVTAMIVPVMFYAQLVCGLTPTRSALLTAPMAIATGLLAPVVGRIVDRAHPRPVIGFGFSVLAIALTWLSIEMTPTTPIWRLVLPFTAMGIAMAFIWSPLAATATRNLAPQLAGAGSGVYNTTRQIGAVLGSAGIAAFMTSRIGAEIPGAADARPRGGNASRELPEFLHEPFAAALSQSVLLPAFIALFGVLAALFLLGFVRSSAGSASVSARRSADPADALPGVQASATTEILPVVEPDPAARYPTDVGDGYVDDDDAYVEFTVTRDTETDTGGHYLALGRPAPAGFGEGPHAGADADPYDDDLEECDEFDDLDDGDTEPLPVRVEHPRHAPAEAWHSAPVQSWHSLLGAVEPFEEPRPPAAEAIGFAHNGFHVDDGDLLQTAGPPERTAGDRDHASDDGFDRLAGRIDSFAESFADLLERHRGASLADSDADGGIDGGHPDPAGGRRARHQRDDDTRDSGPGEFVSKHRPLDGAGSRPGRHHRDDTDDPAGYGRHSLGRRPE